ncbi:DUF2520 domain-containing protein, partial [Myxococcota bacterium]|nr:DUF2520 domain-containing protein [Myxococcota bacterium]
MWVHDRDPHLMQSALPGIPREYPPFSHESIHSIDVMVMAISDQDSYPFPCLDSPPEKPLLILSTGGMHSPLPARDNISCATLHPAMSIGTTATVLTNRQWAYCGEDRDRHKAQSFIAALGGSLCVLSPSGMMTYHALCALLANGTSFLAETATSHLAKFSTQTMDQLRPLIAQLVFTSLEALLQPGGRIFTGPLSRGDSHLIKKHVRALEAIDPQLASLYRNMHQLGAKLMGVDLDFTD